uniref:Uncharacterized protein n=1 Tax=Ornithodoros turicata TaxID=34597 RepID=A0A2R5LFS0_9ACAR
MFRIVEDADGQTKIFLNATNEFLCVVKEKVSRKRPRTEETDNDECRRKSVERRLSDNSFKKLKNECLVSTVAQTSKKESTEVRLPCATDLPEEQWQPEEPPTQAEFLGLFDLISSNESKNGRWTPPLDVAHATACIPLSSLRVRRYLRSLPDADATSAVEAYERYCNLRFLLRTPTFNGFPVAYREPKCCKTWHVYCFGREQRLERRRYLATGLNRRARKLRARCRPAAVELRRLSAAEIAMWEHGRLSPLSLEKVPCLQPRCVISDVRDLVCDGAVLQVSLSDEACAKLNVPASPRRCRSLTASPRKTPMGKENVCKSSWQNLCNTGPVVNGH